MTEIDYLMRDDASGIIFRRRLILMSLSLILMEFQLFVVPRAHTIFSKVEGLLDHGQKKTRRNKSRMAKKSVVNSGIRVFLLFFFQRETVL